MVLCGGFQFYMEVNEVELWMNEKIPQLTSSDLGKDEDSVLVGGTLRCMNINTDLYVFCNSTLMNPLPRWPLC